MNRKHYMMLTGALVFLSAIDPALAYIGPGAGVGAIGALIGLLVGIFTALGVVLMWPIKMLIRKMKAKSGASPKGESCDNADDDIEAQSI